MAAVSEERYRVTPVGEEAREVSLEGASEALGGVEVLQLEAAPGRSSARRFEVLLDGWRFVLDVEPAAAHELRERASRREGGAAARGQLSVRAQIPGRVLQVWVSRGEHVELGQRLVSIEAMKMENEIRAPHAGTIARVSVEPGARVELGDELAVIA